MSKASVSRRALQMAFDERPRVTRAAGLLLNKANTMPSDWRKQMATWLSSHGVSTEWQVSNDVSAISSFHYFDYHVVACRVTTHAVVPYIGCAGPTSARSPIAEPFIVSAKLHPRSGFRCSPNDARSPSGGSVHLV